MVRFPVHMYTWANTEDSVRKECAPLPWQGAKGYFSGRPQLIDPHRKRN